MQTSELEIGLIVELPCRCRVRVFKAFPQSHQWLVEILSICGQGAMTCVCIGSRGFGQLRRLDSVSFANAKGLHVMTALERIEE